MKLITGWRRPDFGCGGNKMKNKKKDITDLFIELYKEVTPYGKELLDKVIDKIAFELQVIRQALDLEKEERR